MSADHARKWIILSSLYITGLQIIFLISAPAFGFPLMYPKNIELLQIITPVFLGYLGSSAHFVFMEPPPSIFVNRKFLGYLVKGPILMYSCSVVAALGSFAYSNRVGSPIGNGITAENLATALSISLGVLSVTTGVITSYLFVVNRTVNDVGNYTATAAQQGTQNR